MIFAFPSTRSKTIDIVNQPGYIHQKTIVTRRPWLRIIWMSSQKTIMLGRYRIHFMAEPDATQHMAAVEAEANTARGNDRTKTSAEATRPSSVVP